MFDKVFKKIQTGISTITTAVKDIANQTTQSRIKVNNKEYLENHLIAEGGFGYIYEVACPQTKRKFALKLINIGNKKQYFQVKNEVELWSKIPKSKNIVDIFDYELTEKKAYIVMELCEEGTLLDYVKAVDKNKIISENEVLNIVLTEKSLVCNKNKINLSCMVDASGLTEFSEGDLYALFGNILDVNLL